MARISNKSQQAAESTKGTKGKVGRVAKGATKSQQAEPAATKGAKGKGTKAAPSAGQQAARAKYAGRKITLLIKPADAKLRGGRAVRFDMVAKAKTTDDVLGASYQLEGEAEPRVFNASNLHPFVDKGYIRIEGMGE